MQGNWPEARLVPHVAGLLLRDVLGMKVEYALDEKNGLDGADVSRMAPPVGVCLYLISVLELFWFYAARPH